MWHYGTKTASKEKLSAASLVLLGSSLLLNILAKKNKLDTCHNIFVLYRDGGKTIKAFSDRKVKGEENFPGRKTYLRKNN